MNNWIRLRVVLLMTVITPGPLGLLDASGVIDCGYHECRHDDIQTMFEYVVGPLGNHSEYCPTSDDGPCKQGEESQRNEEIGSRSASQKNS
jgi:hypothetical protein